jgi:hypothetical protein
MQKHDFPLNQNFTVQGKWLGKTLSIDQGRAHKLAQIFHLVIIESAPEHANAVFC